MRIGKIDIIDLYYSEKEIVKKNYELHIVYCLKNIVWCPFCNERCDVKSL